MVIGVRVSQEEVGVRTSCTTMPSARLQTFGVGSPTPRLHSPETLRGGESNFLTVKINVFSVRRLLNGDGVPVYFRLTSVRCGCPCEYNIAYHMYAQTWTVMTHCESLLVLILCRISLQPGKWRPWQVPWPQPGVDLEVKTV